MLEAASAPVAMQSDPATVSAATNASPRTDIFAVLLCMMFSLICCSSRVVAREEHASSRRTFSTYIACKRSVRLSQQREDAPGCRIGIVMQKHVEGYLLQGFGAGH